MDTPDPERWVLHRIGEDSKRYVVVAECEPREDEVEHLIHKFDVDPEFARGRVRRAFSRLSVSEQPLVRRGDRPI